MTKAESVPDDETGQSNVVSVDFGSHFAKLQAAAAATLAKAAEKIANRKSDGIRDLTTQRDGTLRVNPLLLHVMPGWNKRDMETVETQEHVRWLANDIAKRGVLEPFGFIFRDGKINITSGHCRREAVLLALSEGATLTDVPLVAESKDATDYDIALGQFTRNTGLRYSPYEQGAHYLMLRNMFGKTDTEIAADIHMTSTHVGQCIGYYTTLNGSDEIMALIRSGFVSVSFAIQTISANDGDLESGLKVLLGAVEFAKKAGAKKAMPKHADAFVKSLYGEDEAPVVEKVAETETVDAETVAEETGVADDTAAAVETETVEAGDAAEETEATEAAVPDSTTARTPADVITTTKATTTNGGAKHRETTTVVETAPKETVKSLRRDEIEENAAVVIEKHWKFLSANLNDPDCTALERFLKMILQGVPPENIK